MSGEQAVAETPLTTTAATVEAAPPAAGHPRIAFALAVVGYFMIAVDMTIVSVAMSAISRGLRFSPASLSWITTAFTLTYAGAMMFGGRLVDLFGRRRSFVAGIALFTLASIAAAAAPDAGVLIGARAVQGLGAAITTPCTLALILDLFPEGAKRRRAMGTFQAVIGSGAGFGLVLGGVITDSLGWRWLFLVNIPVGLVILALAPRFLPQVEHQPRGGRRFDVVGAATVTAALALLIYTLSRTAAAGWLSASTLGGIAGALALFLLFGGNEQRSPDPLLPLRIPRNPVVHTANLRAALVSGAFLCALVFVALDNEQVRGQSPTRAGLSLLPAALMILPMGRIGPGLVARFGLRAMAIVAPLVLAAGLLWFATTPSTSFVGSRLGPDLLIGCGATVANLVNMLSATAGADPGERGVVSALQYTAQQTGSSALPAAFTALAAGRAAHLVAGPGALGHAAALHHGYQDAFLAAAAAGLLAALLALPRRNFTRGVARGVTR
ncbi:MFS transporter [Streptacidiphilus sp. PAMC 29251]